MTNYINPLLLHLCTVSNLCWLVGNSMCIYECTFTDYTYRRIYVLFAFVVRFVIIPHVICFCRSTHPPQYVCMQLCICICNCLGRLPTYRNVSPELGHIVVVGAEELSEPADGPLAAFVHCLVSLKVLIVFVD